MTFHSKYRRINKWYQKSMFCLKMDVDYQTDIVGYTYEDEYIKLDRYGKITLKEHFVWGASGLAYDTKSSREGSCIHDGIYYLSQVGVFDEAPNNNALRAIADDLILYYCLKNKMWKIRAHSWYKLLRAFGGKAWQLRI